METAKQDTILIVEDNPTNIKILFSFMNLLANAIDALDEDNLNKGLSYEEIKQNPNRLIIKTSVIKGAGVEIKIADNGPGIPAEMQSRIFEPFVTTKPVGKGTGLGLSICHDIIMEKHGGTLLCNSKLGEGTEFVIAIPQ
ncbi:MAG: HAMP domain-containing histidine kinase [Hormoscilla sp. SP5CHS1]|nr:HAMP domain-containing histidine kinase [Hormoscilla sp. SP12CHS1]MBC6455301.1 HAMP domain-containing histidine kinase [Hormoscilla sp. SP5CHS1]